MFKCRVEYSIKRKSNIKMFFITSSYRMESINSSANSTRAQSAPAQPNAVSTPPSTPAANANATHTFEEIFKIFSKFGDHKSVGDCITLSNSDKWFKQAKVIDGKKITTVDTGIYFKQIAKFDSEQCFSLLLNNYLFLEQRKL